MVHCTMCAQSFSHTSISRRKKIAVTHAFAFCLAMSLTFLSPDAAGKGGRYTLSVNSSITKEARNEARNSGSG